MDQLLALVVVLPLLAAAAISAAGPLLGKTRRILDAVAIGVAASVAIMLMIIMVRTAGGDQVYWFAGFRRPAASRSESTSRWARSAPAWPAWPRCS